MRRLLSILLFIQPLYAADYYETNIKGDRIIVDTIKDVSNKFAPCITLNKWNNEEFLKFTTEGFKFKTDEKTAENTIKLIGDDIEMNCYTSGDDFKAIIIFNKKPASNTYQFKIDGWENLKFCYQKAWDNVKEIDVDGVIYVEKADEPKQGARRLPSVQGSYAVYHKTKKHNKYTTGKAFHIYRPRATDADGKTAWVDIDIKEGVYIATISQDFLDTAEYPVIINDTFGNTDIGGSEYAIQFSQAIFQAPASGTISDIRYYCSNAAGGTRYFTMGFYNDNGGEVGTHVAHGTEETIVGNFAATWKTHAVVGSIVSGNYYWIGMQASSNWVQYWYDTDGSDHAYVESGWEYPDWGNSPSVGYWAGELVSVYATYSTGGAPAAAGAASQILILDDYQ